MAVRGDASVCGRSPKIRGIAMNAGSAFAYQQQAALGAAELAAHITMHRGALAARPPDGVGSGECTTGADLVERGRASALSFPPPRPPDDPVLSNTLSDLRTTMKEIEECRQGGRSAAGLVQRQVRLERVIERQSREMAAQPGAPRRLSSGAAELSDALGDSALLEYIELDDSLHAVTLVSGRARSTISDPPAPCESAFPCCPSCCEDGPFSLDRTDEDRRDGRAGPDPTDP